MNEWWVAREIWILSEQSAFKPECGSGPEFFTNAYNLLIGKSLWDEWSQIQKRILLVYVKKVNGSNEDLRSKQSKPLNNRNRFQSNVQTFEYGHIHAYYQVGFDRHKKSGKNRILSIPTFYQITRCRIFLYEVKNSETCTQKERTKKIKSQPRTNQLITHLTKNN